MAQKALIFGGKGFVGTHLAKQLGDRYDIVSFGREQDVRNVGAVRKTVEEVSPDVVVNLAAITTVRETLNDPRLTYQIAFLGALNILDALRDTHFRGSFLQVGSSEMYGHPTVDELPLTEASPLRPKSPYAVAKCAAELLCQSWAHDSDFSILLARPFTHVGPGQSAQFALARFTKNIAAIKANLREPILTVGNLSTSRDIADVRDVVRAYDVILHRGQPGEVYNVCSGREVVMSDLLEQLIAVSGVNVEVSEDPSLTRGSEQSRLLGCNSKILEQMDWQPKIKLEQTLVDMFSYEFAKIL